MGVYRQCTKPTAGLGTNLKINVIILNNPFAATKSMMSYALGPLSEGIPSSGVAGSCLYNSAGGGVSGDETCPVSRSGSILAHF